MEKYDQKFTLTTNKKYRIFYNKGNLNNMTIHTLAIVDEGYYVYKYYRKSKMSWYYKVEHAQYFVSLYQAGILKEVK